MSETRRPRLCCHWLHACSGCELALLNGGDLFLGLLQLVDIVHFPLLLDYKYASGAEGKPDLPAAEIGLVSGGVASKNQLEVLRTLRGQCRILVAFGTCASHGGIPALRNQWTAEQTWNTVFQEDERSCSGEFEYEKWLDRVYAIDEQVEVDLLLPGCPPRPETIVATVAALAAGHQPQLAEKSVCEHCPTVRTGTGRMSVRRFLANADYDPEAPVDSMRCLLEQGLLCMGPVTVGGCGGREMPLCIRARVPCRGCYGPVRRQGNQLLDLLNVLASKGIDHRAIVDRRSLLRFSGAHGLLKPNIREG
ncbi:MAG: methyl viologen-reducing hydrogenase [Desulfobulbus sp.]|jgi:F420-non-reducing hydrogenase small subunit|uniref:NADH-quinone oxidoreductase subunit B family protein n=1 Tax=Desulfobulbus sp. TaxID=895 RepID=UPI002845E0BB|nr:methyl viologen-reducing hydrogenase [Desulfobulbus sp.]MDR2549130.1 methyl viologen-reducing hydrogenase [Desulfobulbus sp.]